MPCAFHLDYLADFDAAPECQFPKNDLIELSSGQTWCRFHLPMRVEDKETPKARWDEVEVAAFNDAIFAFIDAARTAQQIANLSGVVFPGEISFERYEAETNSLPEVLFVAATFGGTADFWRARFSGHAWFVGARFSGDGDFTEARFSGNASFSKARFSREARFRGASFSGYARFSGARFSEDPPDSPPSLPGLEFLTCAAFSGARFSGEASFFKARFGSIAEFRGASFSDEASFSEARFSEYVLFSEVRFGGEASFRGASFGGHTGFEGAEFSGLADFSAASAAADFPSARFEGAKFSGPAIFHNRKFLGETDFSRAYFVYAPEFHGCTLHQDTLFPKGANFRDLSGAKAALAYRTLKHAMASVHARGEEAKFYVLEQKSLLRDEDTPLSTKLFSVLYWLASDYGQSLLRPLFGLLITFGAFFVIYLVFLMFYLDLTPRSDLIPRFFLPGIEFGDLLRFSLRQVFRPFEAFSLRLAAPADAVPEVLRVPPLPLALLAALHSVVTLSFLALFLLALRRRFKLD